MSATACDRQAATLTATQVIARIVVSVLGGWVFVWGCIAAGIALLVASGMPFDEARKLMHLLAFLIYLVAFFWAFAAASLLRAAVVLLGGGAMLCALSYFLTRAAT